MSQSDDSYLSDDNPLYDDCELEEGEIEDIDIADDEINYIQSFDNKDVIVPDVLIDELPELKRSDIFLNDYEDENNRSSPIQGMRSGKPKRKMHGYIDLDEAEDVVPAVKPGPVKKVPLADQDYQDLLLKSLKSRKTKEDQDEKPSHTVKKPRRQAVSPKKVVRKRFRLRNKPKKKFLGSIKPMHGQNIDSLMGPTNPPTLPDVSKYIERRQNENLNNVPIKTSKRKTNNPRNTVVKRPLLETPQGYNVEAYPNGNDKFRSPLIKDIDVRSMNYHRDMDARQRPITFRNNNLTMEYQQNRPNYPTIGNRDVDRRIIQNNNAYVSINRNFNRNELGRKEDKVPICPPVFNDYVEPKYNQIHEESPKHLNEKASPNKSFNAKNAALLNTPPSVSKNLQSKEKKKKKSVITPMSEIPCKFFREGHCRKTDKCRFNHNLVPEKKRQMCKFYLTGVCNKLDCVYMHADFPCKFYHTGNICYSHPNCKFSHEPLTDETKILLNEILNSHQDCENENNEEFVKRDDVDVMFKDENPLPNISNGVPLSAPSTIVKIESNNYHDIHPMSRFMRPNLAIPPPPINNFNPMRAMTDMIMTRPVIDNFMYQAPPNVPVTLIPPPSTCNYNASPINTITRPVTERYGGATFTPSSINDNFDAFGGNVNDGDQFNSNHLEDQMLQDYHNQKKCNVDLVKDFSIFECKQKNTDTEMSNLLPSDPRRKLSKILNSKEKQIETHEEESPINSLIFNPMESIRQIGSIQKNLNLGLDALNKSKETEKKQKIDKVESINTANENEPNFIKLHNYQLNLYTDNSKISNKSNIDETDKEDESFFKNYFKDNFDDDVDNFSHRYDPRFKRKIQSNNENNED
ncbi:hypothetical protein A3Q56_01955 [Intoshia linei]|uniref:C3H1-type domain-containing protein n=1 Tax=Intoshia linei TaxID=1819745 RepID=A0A177B7N3_9BILA|nr:hypothetical protein A3Q56_01955 [Intoshia linei]